MSEQIALKIIELGFKFIEVVLKAFGLEITISPNIIFSFSDSGLCYFSVPNNPSNKYPAEPNSPSYAVFRIDLTVDVKNPVKWYSSEGYVFDPNSKTWRRLVDFSHLFIIDPDLQIELDELNNRAGEFTEQEISNNQRLKFTVCSKTLGKNLYELYPDELVTTILIWRLNTKYIAMLLKIPSVNLPDKHAYVISSSVYDQIEEEKLFLWASKKIKNLVRKKKNRLKLRI